MPGTTQIPPGRPSTSCTPSSTPSGSSRDAGRRLGRFVALATMFALREVLRRSPRGLFQRGVRNDGPELGGRPDQRRGGELARHVSGMKTRLGRGVGLALALALAACTPSREAPDARADDRTSTATPTPRQAQTPPPQPEPELPEIIGVRQAGGVAIHAPSRADWILVDFGRAWVSAMGAGIGVFDAETGRPQGSVAVPQSPCAGMDAGFGAVWTATCGKRGV